MTNFNLEEWFMKWGFFVFIIICVSMFILMLFILPQEQKDKIEKSPCFYNDNCRNCIGKSYCEEIGLEYKDIFPPYNKIVCFENIFNITTIEHTFNILNRERLQNRYNCEVKK